MATWSSPERAHDVLAYLREHANEAGEVAASFPGIGDALHIGTTTAYRAVRRLLDNHAIEVVRMGSAHRYPTRYRLLEAASIPVRPAA